MRWHKRIRHQTPGVDFAAAIDAVIAVNHGRPGTTTRVDSTSSLTVTQDSRRDPDPGERPHPDDKERR